MEEHSKSFQHCTTTKGYILGSVHSLARPVVAQPQTILPFLKIAWHFFAGKCFRQRVSYLVHRRIHTGVMPYKCNVCDKSFRYKVSQRSHKCAGPQSPVQGEGNNSEETGTEIYNGANYSIKLMDPAISITDGNFRIVAPTLTTENNQEVVINVNVVGDNSDNMSKLLIVIISFGCIYFALAVENQASVNYDNANTDFYSMVLSPLLPEVQSLCLNSAVSEEITEKPVAVEQDVLETINKESLKELLYGPPTDNYI